MKTSKSSNDLKVNSNQRSKESNQTGNKGFVGITLEEKIQKWKKSLPVQVRHLHHLDCIKDQSVTDK